jgi:acetyltransferase-like isoleucine patch superfamily enzyme
MAEGGFTVNALVLALMPASDAVVIGPTAEVHRSIIPAKLVVGPPAVVNSIQAQLIMHIFPP